MSREQPVPLQVRGHWVLHVLPHEAQGLRVQEKITHLPRAQEQRERGETLPAAGSHTQPWHCASLPTRKIGCHYVEPHSASEAHSVQCWAGVAARGTPIDRLCEHCTVPARRVGHPPVASWSKALDVCRCLLWEFSKEENETIKQDNTSKLKGNISSRINYIPCYSWQWPSPGRKKKIRFVFISFIRLPILKPLARMTHISTITLYYAVSVLLPVLSSSALAFVSIKPSNLQLYLKTTCLSGSAHNTLEVIPWGLHLRLLAICPALKGNFSGSVQRSVCLLQSRHLFSNHLRWNHFCASLACYILTCPVRDS